MVQDLDIQLRPDNGPKSLFSFYLLDLFYACLSTKQFQAKKWTKNCQSMVLKIILNLLKYEFSLLGFQMIFGRLLKFDLKLLY